MEINDITAEILDASIKVHSSLVPGLLESVYEEVLAYELGVRGMMVERQVPIKIEYRGISLSKGFVIDLLVEREVVVDLKSIEELKPVHKKQLITYLKLTNKSVGLLINFNAVLLKHGFHRIIN